ncbi:hypothetical protein GcM3_026029 [Golovinomyces cichoracearum]|uniref:Roadblock/LAMTOR2 domain-containing protein n=1 Tax=Golovinomyces cichoracearum TaxID=62708 RepID=A0A420J685_9PEZI|nr:hypothetical protein GcM3_026029 [Golovinomyces cichoracearum]
MVALNSDPNNESAAVTEAMRRLSSKSTVIATLAIDRKTSSVLASSGQTDAFKTSKVTNTPAMGSSTETTLPSEASEFATMIWNYVTNTSKMVLEVDEEDDLKLLRIRTKRYELVIVPENNFIFVVAHEVRP